MENQHHPGDSIARDFNEDVNGKQYTGEDLEDTLARIKTSGAGSVTISSDLFEKLYLQPKINKLPLKHPLQSLFGNPTPIAIVGFEMSLMPITMQLLGWHGAGGSRTTNNATVVMYGAVLMWIGGLLKFVLGNTFPFVVFATFRSFWGASKQYSYWSPRSIVQCQLYLLLDSLHHHLSILLHLQLPNEHSVHNHRRQNSTSNCMLGGSFLLLCGWQRSEGPRSPNCRC
ncbi:hypothetical protein BST61_g10452 [Cercospora zeina]